MLLQYRYCSIPTTYIVEYSVHVYVHVYVHVMCTYCTHDVQDMCPTTIPVPRVLGRVYGTGIAIPQYYCNTGSYVKPNKQGKAESSSSYINGGYVLKESRKNTHGGPILDFFDQKWLYFKLETLFWKLFQQINPVWVIFECETFEMVGVTIFQFRNLQIVILIGWYSCCFEICLTIGFKVRFKIGLAPRDDKTL